MAKQDGNRDEWQAVEAEQDVQPFLLLKHPDGYPKRVVPFLEPLKLTKFMTDFKKGVMRGFLKQDDYNEWETLIKELQDEGK